MKEEMGEMMVVEEDEGDGRRPAGCNESEGSFGHSRQARRIAINSNGPHLTFTVTISCAQENKISTHVTGRHHQTPDFVV